MTFHMTQGEARIAAHRTMEVIMMMAGDVSNPAELVAKYGDVQIHWAYGASLVIGMARLQPEKYAHRAYAASLEMARIRELTRG
jgi:hypothetical protein